MVTQGIVSTYRKGGSRMFVGIDVSKATFDACWDDNGQRIHHQFPYTDSGIQELIKRMEEPRHAVMEATGVYHSRLAVALHEAGFKVSVENPVKIKHFGRMKLSRVKSDKADAALILEYAMTQDIALWEPDEEVIVSLKQALMLQDAVTHEMTMVRNREEAMRHEAFQEPFVMRELKEMRKAVKARQQKCQNFLKATVKKHFPELYERLQTIPSIGPATAIDLIVTTNGFSRFETDKALAAYIGINPTTYSSGTSVKGKGGISRTGRPRTRQLLYICSWTAREVNPACKALGERLRKKGKPPKVISIAIAHKLLRQAFAVARGGDSYRPELA
jgi:transposase